MSCNGCRILRKGCSEDCVLKPCLQWIKSPDSQANATLFLAKFYGRAGLINLISAGPDHLRPETFRSLLYEACGRIVNPVFGSVGLMVLGNWSSCQAAVEAVLKGKPIMQLSTADDVVGAQPIMPLRSSNIRHFSKENMVCRSRTRKRSKRSNLNDKTLINIEGEFIDESTKFSITGWDYDQDNDLKRASSHDSFSVETVEPSLVNRHESLHRSGGDEDFLLRLTLGMN